MTEPILRLDEVCKRFSRSGAEWTVLDGASLEVSRGEIVGVYGSSGAGKTTLLRIAAGLVSPDAGAVFYDGARLDRLSASERARLRRREVSCVWAAQPWQEHLGVLDHVALPLLVDRRDRRTAEHRAQQALLACEVEHCAGMELGEISDGERQRVELARALVSEPRLLLADGPASSLSIVEREAIMALLTSLAREARVAVLIAERDAAALLGVSRIVCLSDGTLIGSDPEGERGRVYRLPSARSRRAAG